MTDPLASADTLLQQAMTAHGGGQLDAADDLYRRVLALRPHDHNALANLGGVLLLRGRLEEGLDAIDASLAIKPEQPAVLGNKAEALRLLGRTDEAVAALEEAGRHDPSWIGRLGDLLCHLDRATEGTAAYDRALGADPGLVAAWTARGRVHRHLGETDLALSDFTEALRLRPDDLAALRGRGETLADLGRTAEAAVDFRAALMVEPAANLWSNLANVELRLGRAAEALDAADRALGLEPERADAWFHRGGALHRLGRADEALAAFERAAALDPHQALVWNAVGLGRIALERHEAALEAFGRALEAEPDNAAAHWNRGALLVLLGRLREGWTHLDRRWRAPTAGGELDRLGAPWFGDAELAGKTLLLHSEPNLGLGDTLQFCRYAGLAADRGARVVLWVEPPLVEVLKTLRGVAEVRSHDEAPPAFDLHCPIMSLPLVFGGVIPEAPYLRADPAKAEAWAKRLGAQTRPRVGLVWAGSFKALEPELAAVNARRNIPLALLESLAQVDVAFYSLQKGPAAEAELAELTACGWGGPQMTDLTADLHDFSDTAALIENLDLVISVDTSTVHMAGAMGRPVWILNRYDTCWRWMLERTDSPWYPSARLFRKGQGDDWRPVVDAVRKALIGEYGAG